LCDLSRYKTAHKNLSNFTVAPLKIFFPKSQLKQITKRPNKTILKCELLSSSAFKLHKVLCGGRHGVLGLIGWAGTGRNSQPGPDVHMAGQTDV